LGEACRLIIQNRSGDKAHIEDLRKSLTRRLKSELGEGIEINGEDVPHIPGCLSLSFKDIEAENLLHEMPDLALSTGSACSSTSGEPSHVLKAMGRSAIDIAGTVRFGIGRPTTEAEIDFATEQIIAAVSRLRADDGSIGHENSKNQNGML
jgi:cysteine desulfurase